MVEVSVNPEKGSALHDAAFGKSFTLRRLVGTTSDNYYKSEILRFLKIKCCPYFPPQAKTLPKLVCVCKQSITEEEGYLRKFLAKGKYKLKIP